MPPRFVPGTVIYPVPNNPLVIIAGNGGAQTFEQQALMPLRVRSVIVDTPGVDGALLEVPALRVGQCEQLMRPIALPLLLAAELDFTWGPADRLTLTAVNYSERPTSVRFAVVCFRVDRNARETTWANAALERVVVPLELPKVPA